MCKPGYMLSGEQCIECDGANSQQNYAIAITACSLVTFGGFLAIFYRAEEQESANQQTSSVQLIGGPVEDLGECRRSAAAAPAVCVSVCA